MRGFLLLIVAGALVLGSCTRRETEAQMRERVLREERTRLKRLARERERARQAEHRRVEKLRRDLADKELKLSKELARRRPGREAKSEAEKEVERLRKQLEAVKRKADLRKASHGMAAPMSARRRYKVRAPAPRRRLKRPRRRRSPSLEGLFE